MIKTYRVFSAALLAFTLISSAQAGAAEGMQSQPQPKKEYTSRFEFSALSSGSYFFNGDGSFGYLGAGISYHIIPGLQLSATAAYLRVSVNGTSGASNYTTWAFGALVGPVINFPFEWDLRDAFFASARYGGGVYGDNNTSVSTTSTDTSRGMLDFSIGKRFRIFEQLSYTPTLGLSKVLSSSGYNNALYRVVPLGFSLFF
jgi:hypothetical protein